MRLDLLEKVADHLENNVSDDTFDMGYWWNINKNCGCAIGNSVELLHEADEKFMIIDDDEIWHPIYDEDVGRSTDGLAIARLFEIRLYEVEYLFYNQDWTKPISRETVIKKIRNFVAANRELSS